MNKTVLIETCRAVLKLNLDIIKLETQRAELVANVQKSCNIDYNEFNRHYGEFEMQSRNENKE